MISVVESNRGIRSGKQRTGTVSIDTAPVAY